MNNLLECTNITIYRIKELDNFFKNQNIEIKNEIFLEKRNQFFKLKNLNPSAELSALEMASYYLAISYFHSLKEKGIEKNTTFSTTELNKYEDYILKSSKKTQITPKKENFLLDKSSIVQSLINENRSYREMSSFFKKYHKMYISHTYIKQVIEKYPDIFNRRKKNDKSD